MRGAIVITRKTNGERTTKNMIYRNVTGEKVKAEKEGGQWDRRGQKYM